MASKTLTVGTEADDQLAGLKTQFLASLNHEVRTPLTGILGMTDLLLETPLDEEQKDYLATVRICADDLLALFNKTLEFSDLSSGRFELTHQEFHLAETLRSAVLAHAQDARAKGLKLTCRLSPDLPEVAIGDALRLKQMLSHVVENAVKFTEVGKVEVIGTGCLKHGKLELMLRVCDTGIGIPAEKQAAVFESFRQLDSGLARAYSGLGLGLPLVHKLSVLMGGEVTVESEPCRGSVFSVILPLEVAAAESAIVPCSGANGAAGPASCAKQRRILLVEDNEVAQRVVTHVLKRGDYFVYCASSGAEAIETASGQTYDAILMDLQMPGLDGFQTTAGIRALPGYEATPIIALTANVTEDHRRLCFIHGMQGFVPKPVQSEQLLSSLAQFLAA
jgi:CheY-like chemotaxis protein